MSKEKHVYIIIDTRENKLIEVLKKKHEIVDLEIKQLDLADIIVSKNVAIERKEGGDFVASIMDNRLFDQLLRLKETYPNPVLILEGLNNEVFENTGMNIKSIYGALAFISYKLGIAVIPTRHLEDTAIVVERIAYREQIKDEMPVLSRSAPKNMDTFERRCFVLEGLLDIGPTKAKQLIERFETPFRVFEAIKFTKILYTSTGNPKGIQGPLDTLRGFGPKFVRKNKKLILGKENEIKKDKEKSILDEYI
jgi:Fanconi anemia group M protein